jgi:hypothetical protein
MVGAIDPELNNKSYIVRVGRCRRPAYGEKLDEKK